MTNDERAQILKMIADGKITAKEGLRLLQALEETHKEASEILPPASEATTESHQESASDLAASTLREAVRRFWQIPLWTGIGFALLSAWGMYALLAAHHLNFWFYCLLAPFLLGVGLIVLAANSHRARWLVVDIRLPTKPNRLFFGFPLPLKAMKAVFWGIRTFGHVIPDREMANVNIAIEALEHGLSIEEPLVIQISESEDGESVKVYLG